MCAADRNANQKSRIVASLHEYEKLKNTQQMNRLCQRCCLCERKTLSQIVTAQCEEKPHQLRRPHNLGSFPIAASFSIECREDRQNQYKHVRVQTALRLRGKLISTIKPPSWRLRMSMVPPCTLAARLAIARPIPKPVFCQ